MPSAATMAFAYQGLIREARGKGMPGMRKGMKLARVVTLLIELASRDVPETSERTHRG